MNVDDFIAEGEAYIQAFPNASRKKVRIYLQSLIDGGEVDSRQMPAEFGTGTSMDNGPMTIAFREFRRWWYRGSIDKAMNRLFDDEE